MSTVKPDVVIMQQNCTSYQYRSLEEGRKGIRLLTLQGRHRNDGEEDTIRCRLTHASLNDKDSYEALSYVWGDTSDQKTIVLDGHSFLVTNNLFVALTHLRKDNKDRCLWIDAICINQGDKKERSSQVAQMQHVYRLAKSVIVFLGEAWPGRDTAMDTMTAMAENRTLHLNPSLEPHVTIHGMDASSKILQSHVTAFFSSPWWTRVWTVQEYCRASDAIFQYGDRSLTDSALRNWSDNFRKHTMTCCSDIHHPRSSEVGSSLYMELGRAIQPLYSLEYHHGREDGCNSRILMSCFRTRRCDDPRDKIYGFLGLLSENERLLIKPDYTRSLAHIYSEAVMASIRSTGSLHILSCKLTSPTSALVIPSYVPDWTAELAEHECLVLRRRMEDAYGFHYKASKRSLVNFYSIAEDIIMLGVQVDRINRIEKADPGESWAAVLDRAQALAERRAPLDSAYEVPTAFWRACCGNLITIKYGRCEMRPAETRDMATYDKFRPWRAQMGLYPLQNHNVDVLAFDDAFQIVATRRCFATTEEGYIGWVPEDSQTRDNVVLLAGGKVPYVVRPVDLSDTGNSEMSETYIRNDQMPLAYTFIGDAYIQGIMQGERWDEKKLEEFRLV